jgi:transcriptional regulator with XRE-family HTH domain
MPKRSQDVPEEYSEYERAIAREIGRRVRLRRIELKLTQEQVRTKMESEGIHISRTQYSRIELGESLLNAAEVVALMRAIEVRATWLLEGAT